MSHVNRHFDSTYWTKRNRHKILYTPDAFFYYTCRSAPFFFLTGSGGSKAAKIASSKTFFRPFCVRAEHSTYMTAPNSRATFSADPMVTGFRFNFESHSRVLASSLKSFCVPTSRNGVFGQWWVISGIHWERNRQRQRERETNRERQRERETLQYQIHKTRG